MNNFKGSRAEWEKAVNAKYPKLTFKADGFRMYAIVNKRDVGMHSTVLNGGWIK